MSSAVEVLVMSAAHVLLSVDSLLRRRDAVGVIGEQWEANYPAVVNLWEKARVETCRS